MSDRARVCVGNTTIRLCGLLSVDCSVRQRSRRHYLPDDQPREVKLDQDDVTRICKRVVDHDVDTKIVAEQFEINRRRVQQLDNEYREDGEIPELETPTHVHEILKEYEHVTENTTKRGRRRPWVRFERYLHENDIKHTLCKVGRPQSNGKTERFFQTYDKHCWRLGTLDEFLAFYNEDRPRMILNWDELETPIDGFDRLLPPPADDLEEPLATEVTTDD